MNQKYFVEVDHHGNRFWYSDPEMKIRHRIGGPAIQWANGSESWHQDGYLHRLDGPASIHPDGTLQWFQFSKLHRLDGPAVLHPNGHKEYWIDNKRIHARQFPKLSREFNQPNAKEMTVAEVEAALGHPVKIIK